jgi:stress-induced morphogen
VSSAFENKTLLERHRMVNEAVKDFMKEIHALSLKTMTPSQWEKKKAESQ